MCPVLIDLGAFISNWKVVLCFCPRHVLFFVHTINSCCLSVSFLEQDVTSFETHIFLLHKTYVNRFIVAVSSVIYNFKIHYRVKSQDNKYYLTSASQKLLSIPFTRMLYWEACFTFIENFGLIQEMLNI